MSSGREAFEHKLQGNTTANVVGGPEFGDRMLGGRVGKAGTGVPHNLAQPKKLRVGLMSSRLFLWSQPKWFVAQPNGIFIPYLPALAIIMVFLSGCVLIVPNARALIHSPDLYESPKFIGARGPLSRHQGDEIIARLERRQPGNASILARHLAFEQAITGNPLTVGNKVVLLENAPVTYRAMLTAIRNATDSINLEIYTFSDDSTGKAFASALIAARRRGLAVNVIYDGFGSLDTPATFFDKMRSNGIHLLEFNPMSPLAARLEWAPLHRDHRKLLIVDGKVAITGGINIGEKPELDHHGEDTTTSFLEQWRDTDVEIKGPAVQEFQSLFIAEWNSQKGHKLASRDYYPLPERQGNQIVRVIGSIPEQFSLIYVTLISAITNAETNIYITDAYFAPTRQMLKALEAAAHRGVDVRLLVPSRSDMPFTVSAARADYSDLMRAGVKIYEWQGVMIHAKTATIDGVWSTVGTSNLDWWSTARNNEINAVILGYRFGHEMNQMFKNDLTHSDRINPSQWKDRPLLERIEEETAGMIEPIL